MDPAEDGEDRTICCFCEIRLFVGASVGERQTKVEEPTRDMIHRSSLAERVQESGLTEDFSSGVLPVVPEWFSNAKQVQLQHSYYQNGVCDRFCVLRI